MSANEIFARGIDEVTEDQAQSEGLNSHCNSNLFDEAEGRSGVREVYLIAEVEDGSPVTTLDGCWPLGSNLGGAYEHPEGIFLDRAQVDALGIEIED